MLYPSELALWRVGGAGAPLFAGAFKSQVVVAGAPGGGGAKAGVAQAGLGLAWWSRPSRSTGHGGRSPVVAVAGWWPQPGVGRSLGGGAEAGMAQAGLGLAWWSRPSRSTGHGGRSRAWWP